MAIILNISAALCAGISIFRLITLFLDMKISEIIHGFIMAYQNILKPIIFVLGPVFEKIAAFFHVPLPYFWPHIFVIWVVLGGIAGRAIVSEIKSKKLNIKLYPLGLLVGIIFGPISLLLSFIKSIFNANKDDFYFLWYIFRETSFVIISVIVFFATNSFALESTYINTIVF